jgi:hypothetical protein
LSFWLTRASHQHRRDASLVLSCINLTYPRHYSEVLRRLRYAKDALVLEIIGRSWEAWKRPHISEEEWAEAMQLVAALIYRMLGPELWDVDAINKARLLGFPANQWHNLLSNVDSHMIALKRLDPSASWEKLHQTAFTTLLVESYFSGMASAVLGGAGGKKPTGQAMQGRLQVLDVVGMIKYDQSRASSFRVSYPKRAMHDMGSEASTLEEHWHTPKEGAREKYLQDTGGRSKGYTKNKAGTNRAQAQKASGLFSGGAFRH